jgi:acyl dehydratase
MSVSLRRAADQVGNIGVLARVGLSTLRDKPDPNRECVSPGPELTAVLPPRSDRLIADYIRWTGGDRRAWRGRVPPHLFPQWGFDLLAKTLGDIPYPINHVLNQGCSYRSLAPLPTGQPLHVSARRETLDVDERRARITQRLVTGTADVPEAVVAELYTVVRLPKREGASKSERPRREPPRVPMGAQEVGRVRFNARAGLDFALLTGDFNPIHWIPLAARAAGFKRPILHGFGTLACSVEAVVRNRLAGRIDRLDSIDVRFLKPLILPQDLGVYVVEQDDGTHTIATGAAPGGPAFMLGAYTVAS